MQRSERLLLIGAGTALLLFLLWYFRGLLLYFVAAAIISLIVQPLMQGLDRLRFRRFSLPGTAQALLALLLLYGGIALVLSLIIPQLVLEMQRLRSLDTANLASSFSGVLAQAEVALRTFGLLPPESSLEAYIKERVLGIASAIDFSALAGSLAGATGDLFIGLFSVSFIAFFLLKERTLLFRLALTITPPRYSEEIKNVFQHSRSLLSRYFAGLLLETLLVGGLISLGLWLLGVDNAVLIGFLAGMLNVIPYLGPLIGTLTGLAIILLHALGQYEVAALLPLLLSSAAVFVAVQMLDNFLFQPLIYSSSVKAHPLEIFFVILAASSLAGVAGMILAVPAYTLLRVIAREFFSQFHIVQSWTRDIS